MKKIKHLVFSTDSILTNVGDVSKFKINTPTSGKLVGVCIFAPELINEDITVNKFNAELSMFVEGKRVHIGNERFCLTKFDDIDEEEEARTRILGLDEEIIRGHKIEGFVTNLQQFISGYQAKIYLTVEV